MPESLSIGPMLLSVPMLGLVTGFFLTTWSLGRFAATLGVESSWAGRTVELSVLGGVVAARVWFVAMNGESYLDDPVSVLYFWQPGYSFTGGIVAALSIAAWRIHRKRGLWRQQSLLMLVGGATTMAVGFSLIAGLAMLTANRDFAGSGDTIADFELQDLDGDTVRWSELRGEVVLLNFWATWCPPCRREMPLLDSVNKAYATRGVQVIGVAVGEPAHIVRDYVNSIGVSYPIWLGGDEAGQIRTQQIFDKSGSAGLPTSLFVDRDGVIRKRYVGELSRGFIDSEIKPLLSE